MSKLKITPPGCAMYFGNDAPPGKVYFHGNGGVVKLSVENALYFLEHLKAWHDDVQREQRAQQDRESLIQPQED